MDHPNERKQIEDASVDYHSEYGGKTRLPKMRTTGRKQWAKRFWHIDRLLWGDLRSIFIEQRVDQRCFDPLSFLLLNFLFQGNPIIEKVAKTLTVKVTIYGLSKPPVIWTY